MVKIKDKVDFVASKIKEGKILSIRTITQALVKDDIGDAVWVNLEEIDREENQTPEVLEDE